MKLNNKLIALAMSAATLSLVSCENQDIDFPDYEGGVSVYFPYQTPVRTIVLGSDEYDTTLDKEHKCLISATMGGAYKGRNITIDVAVDESLCNNLVSAATGEAVKAMPSNYYNLSSNQIAFKGKQTGSVEVQLADAFFADPASVANTYVIPLVMKNQTGADRILAGEYDGSAAPSRTDVDAWKVTPKDYVLYCVKYKNKYDAFFSRCGKYALNGAAAVQIPAESDAKFEGHFDPVVDGKECNTVSMSMNTVKYAVDHTVNGTQIKCELLLTFEGDACKVSSLTDGVTATGNGLFTPNGAKKAWGNKDRDHLTLNYTLASGDNTLSCDESLVWIRSGVKLEELDVKYVAE